MDSEEFLDIVDPEDRVIGSAPRHEVHARGLCHRASHVLLYNARWEILLQRRSLRKEFDPGRWDSSASGHVVAGEDYLTAAVREVLEELGVSIPPDRLRWIGKLSPTGKTAHEFVAIFLGPIDHPLHPSRREILQTGYFSLSWIDQWTRQRPEDFAPAFLAVWEACRDGMIENLAR
ncbi:NUDIX hydrolase [Candidatus Methylacidithermus pantelleriae]|uniref:Putative Isopentenyl-diphosphate Delta-isomerase n=1 Tax=Candidatus Methylacidithermus pantelleriae TaxID=2744239 RepID=A0A8J2BQK1_9BACT|nr:NUDIX domain-containing protein [Candidatus Methylacidithermus pantelleriae]CAF0689229.1 putative Isopentenyl-diphosphate Delta-isomerase [Candidatus Methylacidithermus pantelleriae]